MYTSHRKLAPSKTCFPVTFSWLFGVNWSYYSEVKVQSERSQSHMRLYEKDILFRSNVTCNDKKQKKKKKQQRKNGRNI